VIPGASAHSRASGIFPASLKPSAFAKAWFRDRRSAADSFPDQALWALRSAADVPRMVLTQVGFRRVTISTFNVLIATSTRRPDHRADPGRGQSEVSGCLSNLRSPSGRVIHGCALRVQKCTVGSSQEVSSNVPARTTRRSPGAVEVGSGPLQIHDPHSGQTQRVTVRPLSAVRWIGRGRAPERMNASVSMTTPIENALPVWRWHSVQ
jgi:hypothetical protein